MNHQQDSAAEILDVVTNREFALAVHGERPQDPALADRVLPGSVSEKAIERDATRFGRALDR